MPDTEYETRTREITIERHIGDGYKNLVAVASVEVVTNPDGEESYGEVTYSVTDNEQVTLTEAEKLELRMELGIPPDVADDEIDQDDEISEEDFEDANPEENEEEEEDTKA